MGPSINCEFQTMQNEIVIVNWSKIIFKATMYLQCMQKLLKIFTFHTRQIYNLLKTYMFRNDFSLDLFNI